MIIEESVDLRWKRDTRGLGVKYVSETSKKLCVRPRLFNIQNTREETLFPWSGRYLGAIGRKNLGDFKQGARKGPGIRRCRKQKYL